MRGVSKLVNVSRTSDLRRVCNLYSWISSIAYKGRLDESGKKSGKGEREIKVKKKIIIEARTQVHGKEKTDTRKHTKIKEQLK